MNRVNKFFVLNEELKTNYTSEQLTELISGKWSKEFNIEWLTTNEYKFLANFSFGTLSLMGSPGALEGIKIYSKIIMSDEETKIRFYTKIRSEIYLFLILSIVLPVVFYNNKEECFPIWVYFLMPMLLIFFGFVYRVQEKILLVSVREYFKKL